METLPDGAQTTFVTPELPRVGEENMKNVVIGFKTISTEREGKNVFNFT